MKSSLSRQDRLDFLYGRSERVLRRFGWNQARGSQLWRCSRGLDTWLGRHRRLGGRRGPFAGCRRGVYGTYIPMALCPDVLSVLIIVSKTSSLLPKELNYQLISSLLGKITFNNPLELVQPFNRYDSRTWERFAPRATIIQREQEYPTYKEISRMWRRVRWKYSLQATKAVEADNTKWFSIQYWWDSWGSSRQQV